MTGESIVKELTELRMTSNNHEERLDNLEKLDGVVSKLADTVDKTSKSVEIMADAINKLQQNKHDEEILYEHSFRKHVWKLIKDISIPQWITYIVVIAGVIVAISKLI